LAYIFTRPLGASFGDLLSQPSEYGGLGFGTVITSLLFLAAIVAIVIYMSLTHEGEEDAEGDAARVDAGVGNSSRELRPSTDLSHS
jgi:hypothetical protein